MDTAYLLNKTRFLLFMELKQLKPSFTRFRSDSKLLETVIFLFVWLPLDFWEIPIQHQHVNIFVYIQKSTNVCNNPKLNLITFCGRYFIGKHFIGFMTCVYIWLIRTTVFKTVLKLSELSRNMEKKISNINIRMVYYYYYCRSFFGGKMLKSNILQISGDILCKSLNEQHFWRSIKYA